MDIHFCDLCNESVPQSDLDQGRAFVRRGRVVCAACERAMTHAEGAEALAALFPDESLERESQERESQERESQERESQERRANIEPQPIEPTSVGAATEVLATATSASAAAPTVAPTSSLGALPDPPSTPPAILPATTPAPRNSGLVLAMIALIFAAGAVAVLNEQIRAIGEHGGALESRLRTQDLDLRDFERSNTEAQRTIASLESQLGAQLAGERERADAALAELRLEAQRLKADQKVLLARLDELRSGSLEKVQDAERRTSEMTERLAKSEADGKALLDRLAKLEEQAQRPAPPPVASGAVTPTAARWGTLVNDLQSPKAATRWEAVDQIGQTGDPEAVPHLLPMLKDTDVFVRMATARVLGDLHAMVAVPALIDALEDPEAAVREAALGSLRGITGKDLRFDPLASESDRSKKVKAWRDWWKKVEEEGGIPKGQG